MIKSELKLQSENEKGSIVLPESLIECEDLKDLLSILAKFRDWYNMTWIYRGMPSSDYRLSTTLQRAVTNEGKRKSLYLKTYLEFISVAHNFVDLSHIPDSDDILGWEALIQHYSGPTRLLDWTFSPYIAAFFAASTPTNSDNACIWCLNKSLIEIFAMNEFYRKKIFLDDVQPEHINIKENFNRIHEDGLEEKWGFVLPIQPRKKNERMNVQQGLFTLIGNMRADFEFNLNTLLKNPTNIENYKYDNILHKIVFPVGLGANLLTILESMNVSFKTLFPDLDGLGKYLSHLCVVEDYKFQNKNLWSLMREIK